MPVKGIALYIFVNDILKPNNHDEEMYNKMRMKCMRRNNSRGQQKE